MSNKGIELLTKLFYSSGEGIMFFSEQGSILTANPRAEEIFGYSEEEMAGKPVEMLIPSKYKKKHQKYRDAYIKHPSPKQMGSGRDLEGIKKDGTTFPVEISLSYLHHEDEKLIVAFILDISIRKDQEAKLEEQRKTLKEYTSALEKKVKERTSELEHLNLGLLSQIQERKIAENALKESLEELKKAEKEILQSLEKEKELNELKSRFVSMASHEFRTPLTTILSSANLISRYKEEDKQENREKHITRIRNSVHNLTTILNDFLSLEKLETGALTYKAGHVVLDALITETIEEMQLSLKKGQSFNYENCALELESDLHMLKNILINLLSNAIKYSTENDKIEICCENKKKQLSIHVRDYGIGIPDSEQKNMFSRFFRAGNATNIKGTGLGLTIVKRYAELMGGTITFKSAEGKGSTFTLSLPYQS